MADLPPPKPQNERDLLDDVREIAHGAIGVTRTSKQAFADLSALADADWRLARAALTRFFLYSVFAAVLSGTAWLLIMALTVFGLWNAGFGWWVSLGVPCVLSAVIAGMFGWLAHDRLMLASMDTTWRQIVLIFKKAKGFERERADHAPR